MKFAGFMKNSFIDYPGHISAVVFTYGCNLNCWYCHNSQLIPEDEDLYHLIDESEVFSYLTQRKKMIEGVVISGGEPTLQKDLKDFIKKVKAFDFKVKLDTNGTNPEILKELIEEKLIDFVAMDIKTSFENYEELVGGKRPIIIEDIKKSIQIIMNSGVSYEFRTTLAPDVFIDDIIEIAKQIKNAKSYAIQKYVPGNQKLIKIPHKTKIFEEALEQARKFVPNAFLRGM